MGAYHQQLTRAEAAQRNFQFSIPPHSREQCPNHLYQGFSLIEIMVTVGLLSFIILGLLAMFNQTQRAFKTSITQTDVLEAGRATMDMLGRELEQMTPSEGPDYVFGNVRTRATNFFVQFTPGFWPVAPSGTINWPISIFEPLVQDLPGNALPRSNLVQRFFFLSKVNQDLIGTGYEVIPDDPSGSVGTLYRFSGTNFRSAPVTMSGQFLTAASLALQDTASGLPISNMIPIRVGNTYNTNYVNRVADGVVHFRVRAFAKNGFLLMSANSVGANPVVYSNVLALTQRGPYTNMQNTAVYSGRLGADALQGEGYFMSNALPAYVEVELGILEPQILRKYRSIETAIAQRNYLTNHAAQVHLFRQRIPVRNLDFTAYP